MVKYMGLRGNATIILSKDKSGNNPKVNNLD